MAIAKQVELTIDAVYEHGVFRALDPQAVKLSEGQRVRLVVEIADEALDSLELLGQMYDGLSEEQINEIDKIVLDRSDFFGDRPLP